jgi:hypothetical protein
VFQSVFHQFNHDLYGYLLAGGWNAEEFAAMSAMKAAKYLPFRKADQLGSWRR